MTEIRLANAKVLCFPALGGCACQAEAGVNIRFACMSLGLRLKAAVARSQAQAAPSRKCVVPKRYNLHKPAQRLLSRDIMVYRRVRADADKPDLLEKNSAVARCKWARRLPDSIHQRREAATAAMPIFVVAMD